MHDSVEIVELCGRFFWKCGCGASSNIGFTRRTAALYDAKTYRHGS